jgi:hypothetical protein
MAAEGQTFQLDTEGAYGGIPFVIVDYERKTVSLVEVLPQQTSDPIGVWEVQDYTVPGN